MDFKEYSRLRSIARKRIERASAQGLMPYVYIPSVREIKSSETPEKYLRQVKDILESGYTVTSAKRASAKAPQIEFTPTPASGKSKPSEAERLARRREQNRRSKAKRAVERSSSSPAEARKKVGYLKALETVSKAWREKGVDIGNWLGVMSPGMSQKFVDYMEYRFSQGDYKNRYTIDTFIRDFGELVKKGYDFKDIQADFSGFLQKQKELERGQTRTNKYGISSDLVDSAWRNFVKGV